MTWYLSFATDAGFLGACIVDADDEIGAVRRSHALGCNPGGEVAILEWPENVEPCPSDMRNRLLSKAEVVERLQGERVGDQEQRVQERFDAEAGRVCGEHNKP